MSCEKAEPFRKTIRENLGFMLILWEVLKSIFGFSVHTFPALLLALVEEIPTKYFPDTDRKLKLLGDSLKAKLHKQLDEGCVLITPSVLTPAPLHGESFYSNNLFLRF